MGTQTPQHPESAHAVRQQCRSGALASPTAGLALGCIQANLIVLPSAAASDFLDLCRRNPVPCPLLARTPVGDATTLVDAAGLMRHDFDIRTDLPRYNVYRRGELVATKADLREDWTPDHVGFLIGCSFSFEGALDKAGLTPRHWTLGCNVSMYRTTRRLDPAGVFTGASYVVSMRPYRLVDVDRVRRITRPYLGMHGEPIDWGWDACERLGIKDVAKPEFGDAVEIREDEVPVFWGCGVTPQAAAMEAGSLIEGDVLAHAPGHMMVLDITDEEMFSRVR